MAAGIALEDHDRWPWLDALNRRLHGERDAVVTCSALKESYRRRLLNGVAQARIVYLHAPKAVIAERLVKRKHKRHRNLLMRCGRPPYGRQDRSGLRLVVTCCGAA